MASRDRLSIRPGLASQGSGSSSEGSGRSPLPPEQRVPGQRAKALMNRLTPRLSMRLVQDEADISPEAAEACESAQRNAAAVKRQVEEPADDQPLPFPLARSARRSNPPAVPAQVTAPKAQAPIAPRFKGQPSPTAPAITDAADPRWVLALRTAESLQGAILGPEKRERLVKIGKMMGMTAFDANLVIAIIQDQARRGYAPDYCPTAGEAQLAMVPLPKPGDSDIDARTRRIGIICGVISVLVGIEMVVLKWLFS